MGREEGQRGGKQGREGWGGREKGGGLRLGWSYHSDLICIGKLCWSGPARAG